MTKSKDIVELESLFLKVHRKFKARMDTLFEGQITYGEFLFLKFLYEKGPSKASDISNEFEVTLSHITTLSNRLISKEFIYRMRPEEDRRTIEIGLSPKGKEIIERFIVVKEQYFQYLYRDVSEGELKYMIDFYTKLLPLLDQ